MLGVLVCLILLETKTLKTVEVQTEYLDYFTRDIQSLGSSLMCVLSDIEKTSKTILKLARQLNTTYLWVVDFVSLLVTVCTCYC